MSAPDHDFMTAAEAAAAMRVSKMTIYRLIDAGELPAVRVGRSFRLPSQGVERYLGRAVVRPESPQDAPEERPTDLDIAEHLIEDRDREIADLVAENDALRTANAEALEALHHQAHDGPWRTCLRQPCRDLERPRPDAKKEP